MMTSASIRGRLHELKKGLFSAPKLNGVTPYGTEIGAEKGPFISACKHCLKPR